MEMEFLQLQELYGGKQTTEKKIRQSSSSTEPDYLSFDQAFHIKKKYLSVIINFGTLSCKKR